MYEPRTYRSNANTDRFEYFNVIVEESDLWIAVEKNLIRRVDQRVIREEIVRLREELKDYIRLNPEFQKTMNPLPVFKTDPPIVQKLKETGIISGTGPMSGVAGLMAEKITKFIQHTFSMNEIIVENGGDICMKIVSELNLAISAGENSAFKNLGIKILPSENVIGVCSSSGTFGHSISFGKADLLTVISHDTTLADAWATSLANRIKSEDDIESICTSLPENVLALLAIKNNKISYKGDYVFINLG